MESAIFKLTTKLLQIRAKQIFRAFAELGFFRILFMLSLLVFTVFAIYANSHQHIVAQTITFVFCFIVLLIQINRKDKKFLQTNFSKYKYLIYAEYLVLSIPIVICFLINKQYLAILSLNIALPIIPHINISYKRKVTNTKLHLFIPPDSIEWKAGVRKHFYSLITIWILTAIFSFFIAVVPISLFFLGLLALNFFEHCESVEILLSYERKAHKLLILKLSRQIKLFSFLALPLIILFLIFNYEFWYIIVAEYFALLTMNIYIIMAKYAFYEPNSSSVSSKTIGALGTLFSLIPVFMPVVWIMTIWFYLKSIDNLNFYLNDYN